MQTETDYLLIGGGLASASAAETLRKEGATGRITILSAEGTLPYHRPPLSKSFLLRRQSKKGIYVLRESYYKKNGIEVVLNTRARALDPEKKLVITDQSGDFLYDKLLIATGTKLKKLDVPGSDLEGIYYLRTVEDAQILKSALQESERAVVVGSSFIGMELASTFAQKGIHTTIITIEDLLFSKLLCPEISRFFTDYYLERGVDVVFKETVKEFQGETRLEGVVATDGKVYPCDIAALGIGVAPEVDFLRGSGIEVDDGVVVDEYMKTNREDVYAAGDVARFYDPVFRKYRRIEHWDNALKQGNIAAKYMLGQDTPYRDVSYFFSDVFDLTVNFLGDTVGDEERILRGSPEEKSFSILYLKDNRLRAAFFLRRPAMESNAAGSLIMNRVDLGSVKERLSDASFPLEAIPNQRVLVLQGGGALGAFQCGVIRAMEERGICPDIVAGVSIGAFNAAIIASNPKDATPALESFWDELSIDTVNAPVEGLRRALSSWQSLVFGSPKFFRPRWLRPGLNPPVYWKSYYDPSPVVSLLEKYVDFESLKESPTRLLVSAVNVETGELETFDSYRDDVTPYHILASGSLPPGLPWTTIDGKHYWDGGIVTNSPLNQVIDHCGIAGKKVYVVNLYSKERELPRNMMEVMARRDEIFYSEKLRKDVRTHEIIEDYKKLVDEIMDHLEPGIAEKLKSRPRYIRVMGRNPVQSIVHITHEGEPGEQVSKDYDFSRRSVLMHRDEGYEKARLVLEQEAQ